MARSRGRPPKSEAEISDFQSKIANRALEIYRAEGFDAVSMRRLAKDIGCAPMTIYAHFERKTDILRRLWKDVLDEVAEEIRMELEAVNSPAERLKVAAHAFASYWINNPDHFRLVFMSNEVTRSDVKAFVQDDNTLAHFKTFEDLVRSANPKSRNVSENTDALIAGLIGVALCINTIKDHAWSSTSSMIDPLIKAVTS